MNQSSKCRRLLRENKGQELHDNGSGNDFSDRTPKAQGARNRKIGHHGIKVFSAPKDSTNKIKRLSHRMRENI